MPSPTPSYEDIVQSFRSFLADRCAITNFSEGSVAGALVDMLSTEMSKFYDSLAIVESSRDIDLATGDDLDNLARPFGILRRGAQSSGATSASPQVTLTNASLSPLSVPVGTFFWSPSNPASRYVLTATTTISPGAAAAVFVQGQRIGAQTSVGAGQLTATNGPLGLIVSNSLPITGGRDQEDDESYRYRITQTLRSSVVGGPSSLAGVQLYLQSLPNIIDVILIPQARGPASLDAIIVTETGIPDDDFLTAIQEQMSVVCAAGISVLARAPSIKGITATVAISAPAGTPTSSLKSSITGLIQGYIDSRTPGLPPNSYAPSADASVISYSALLAEVTDTVRSVLGSTLSGITLLLSVDGQNPVQGDLKPGPGAVFRTNSVSLRVANT